MFAPVRTRPARVRALPLCDFAQLRYASDLDPLDHEDVSSVIENGAVRRDELAGREVLALFGAELAPFLVRVLTVAQMRDHFIVLVHESHASEQIRNDDHAVLFVEVTGELRALDEVDVLAFESEALDAAVRAVRD